MKFVQHARVKRILEGINFPLGVPVEVPGDFPIQASDMVAMGFTVVHDPTPNLRPKDVPDTTPILVDSKTEPPVLHEEIKTEPPPPVEETKTDKPAEFHRNPAIVNRKK